MNLKKAQNQKKLIKKSGLFDLAFYTEQTQKFATEDDAIEHYLKTPLLIRRYPNKNFSVQFYLTQYPDVQADGVEPFVHYLQFGMKESREIYSESFELEHGEKNSHLYMQYDLLLNSDYFDEDFYLKHHYEELAELHPAIHYLLKGASLGHDPSELFSTAHYLEQYSDVKKSGLNPLIHYILHGQAEGRTIKPLKQKEANDENLDYISLIIQSKYFDPAYYAHQIERKELTPEQLAQNYLEEGYLKGIDPSDKFSTNFYIDNYPDVKSANVNPLLHYILFGALEDRLTKKYNIGNSLSLKSVDIVIPVYNALDDVKKCLNSVVEKDDGYLIKVLAVNDGSNQETTDWLREFSESYGTVTLIEHEINKGYTKAVNTGLRHSEADYVVTLNSDTIVTTGWLTSLIKCLESDSNIGIAGPLSNAASWQSVPILFDDDGAFCINQIPLGLTPDEFAQIVSNNSERSYPRLPFVNGFCFMIKKNVLQEVGYMDEENFPLGYGEENDFCIRAIKAGYELAIADDSYVFHAKSKSFGHTNRKKLSQQGALKLREKHTKEYFESLITKVKNTSDLDKVRKSINNELLDLEARAVERGVYDGILSSRILFVLPVNGGGGGSHSVVQEAHHMISLGVKVNVAVKRGRKSSFLEQYKELEYAQNLFIEFDDSNILVLAKDYDIAIGTVFHSMWIIKNIVNVFPHIIPAYYIQDYEPYFFQPESESWKKAKESYELIPESLCFAKTDWIRKEVRKHHNINVHKVNPSIDHDVYRVQKRLNSSRINITAMIRPQTPVRGAEKTMRLLKKLSQKFDNLDINIFGCTSSDSQYKFLDKSFEFTNHGILKRPQVSDILGKSDVFVDLSDYQAFGRTSLEAMACGVVPILPTHGGGDEYAIDNFNSIVVDTLNEDECFEKANQFLKNWHLFPEFQRSAIQTATEFSVNKAAISELCLFSSALSAFRKKCPIPTKKKLALVPTRRGDGIATGSGFVRVNYPYSNPHLLGEWDVNEMLGEELPKPSDYNAVVIQRDIAHISQHKLESWLTCWKEKNNKLIFEIDDDLFEVKALKERGFAGDAEKLKKRIIFLAKSADLVTVSTEKLKELLLEYNNNVRIVPNFLDEKLWEIGNESVGCKDSYIKKEGDPIRIGYIGTPTHDSDLKIIQSAMNRLKSEFGSKIEIEVIGAYHKTSPLFGSKVALPKANDYTSFVKWLHKRVHWDIGVIPLKDDDFNLSKSNLKFLEYTALDLAIVCSDVPTYKGIAEHGKNCLVASNNEQAWYQAVKTLIVNDNFRESIRENAYKDISENYTVEKNISVYLDVLN
ncbi:glycosyltransferase [Shewanella maritima]|uniref:glycosyltransferase n=1 Tax=Shewanella maritima TaxID=2520507 RepID=UPI003736B195